MDILNTTRWQRLAALILPLLLLSICSGTATASWRFPEESSNMRSFRSSRHLVHPLYTSYNLRPPPETSNIDRTFSVDSNEEHSEELHESNSYRHGPLKSVPASSPLHRAPTVNLPLQSQSPEYRQDFLDQTMDATGSYHAPDSRLPPYRLYTVGQSIQIGDPYGIQDPNIVYPGVTSSSSLPIATPPVYRNWSNPMRNSEESFNDDWEPFIGSASILHPHHHPRPFSTTENGPTRRGSLRFPANRSPPTKRNGIHRDERPRKTPDSQTGTVRHQLMRKPNIEEQYGLKTMSLEDFQNAGGFHTLDVDEGDYVFDGHSNIIFRTKVNPPSKPLTGITIAPRWEQSTTPSTRTLDDGLEPAQKELETPQLNQPSNSDWRSQRVRPPSRNHHSNGRGKRRSRKRHFNNIAEIIEAQEERDRRKARLESHAHDDTIPPHAEEVDDDVTYRIPYKDSRENSRKPKRWIKGIPNSDFHYGRNHLSPPSLSLLPSVSFQHHVNFASPHTKVSEFVDQPFIHGERPTKASIHFLKNDPVYHPPVTHRTLHSFSDAQGTSYQHSSADTSPYTKSTLFHENTLPMANKARHHSEYDHDYYKAPRSYHFGYDVKSHKHRTRFLHRESRKGHTVSGEYRVQLPDGRVQIVQYTADETGYHPIVTYARPDHDLSAGTTDGHGDYAAGGPISHSQFNTFH